MEDRLAAGDSGKMLTGAHFYETPGVLSLLESSTSKKSGVTAGAQRGVPTHLELCLCGKCVSGPGEVWVCAAHGPGRRPDFLVKPKPEPTGPLVPSILVSITGNFPAGLNGSGSLWLGGDGASRSSREHSGASVARGRFARPFGSDLREKRSS